MRVSPGASPSDLPPGYVATTPSRVIVLRVPQLLVDAVDTYSSGTGRSRSVVMRMALVMFLAAAARGD